MDRTAFERLLRMDAGGSLSPADVRVVRSLPTLPIDGSSLALRRMCFVPKTINVEPEAIVVRVLVVRIDDPHPRY